MLFRSQASVAPQVLRCVGSRPDGDEKFGRNYSENLSRAKLRGVWSSILPDARSANGLIATLLQVIAIEHFDHLRWEVRDCFGCVYTSSV